MKLFYKNMQDGKLYNMNQLITKFKLLLFILFVTGSCTKNLEQLPISTPSSATFFNSAKAAEAALTGAYNIIANNSRQHYIWGYLIDDCRSDNQYASGNGAADIVDIDFFRQKTTNYEPVQRAWADLYNAIGNTNLILDNINQVKDPALTDARKNEIIGEAKFLRSLHYFHLVRLFGGVVLQLSTTDADIYKTRASAEDVYKQIEKDLTEAEAVLPATFPNAPETRSRATKGGAQALLAKVYAQEGKYQQCLDYCNKVTSSPVYSLLANYDWLFDSNHKGSTETIFEVQHVSNTNTGSFAPGLVLPPSVENQKWTKFMSPTHDLVKAYKNENDMVRFKSAIKFDYNADVPSPFPYQASDSIPYIWKFGRNLMGYSSSDNQIFIRLADIMLLKAEALNKLGQTAQAIPLVNQIRGRVSLPPTTVTSQSDVALAILKERRLEMAFEGERWYDLLRYGKQYTIDLMKSQKDGQGNNLNYQLDENRLIYPVPQLERDNNKNLSQNPGY
jgi:starch-binding outer membrane protein, SusD/RagB family